MTLDELKKSPSAQPPGAEGFRPPTKSEVSTLINSMGWTQLQLHKMLNISYAKTHSSTANKWVTGDRNEKSPIAIGNWMALLLIAGILTPKDFSQLPHSTTVE